ncbi:MAG: energy-coupling factor ABC transporter ATP-binding protein [Vibrio sp.]
MAIELNIINIKNLSFSLTDSSAINESSKTLLQDISLRCEAANLYGIEGGNGSGKTTLARLISGFYPHFLAGGLTVKDSGSASVTGIEIGSKPLVEMAQHVQLIQQSPQLQLSGCTFTVEEEIAFGPENLCLAEDEIWQRIEQALTFTSSHKLRHRHPASLSGGESQRVVIASALAMKPKLLVLDEAFSRLTPENTELLIQQLKTFTQQTQCSVLFFEKSLTKLAAHCAKTWKLEQGRLFEC